MALDRLVYSSPRYAKFKYSIKDYEFKTQTESAPT